LNSKPLLASPLASYSQLIVFGDSLSDMGNACPKGNMKKATVFCPLYSNQRFSDGQVWIEHLAKDLSLDLSPSSLGGNNFAFGGASSGYENGNIPGLRKQLETYLLKVQDSADPDALYVIWIGGNDFKNKFASFDFLNLEELLFEDLLNEISNAVKRLSRKGAQHFLIPNLPPVHRTPIASGLLKGVVGVFTGLSMFFASEDKKGDIYEKDSTLRTLFDFGFEILIGNYNWELALRLETLREERLVTIHHPDIYHLFQDAEENPIVFGLETAHELFCFDMFHPSSKGHKIIAQEIAKSL
jgi:phospholipase/lecithinase/hemolysin